MIAIGPTWRRTGPGQFYEPPKTLGWTALAWTAENLLQPDGPNAGEPWKATKEQTRFILNWYAIDAQGRFVYRYGMLRRMKGWGKDPLGAVLCAIEFVGPCRFAGWDRAGEPLSASHAAAWVQTAAVSKDQTRNTMTLFPGLFSPACIEANRIDLGKEIIYADNTRRRLEAVTSSPRALEGGRATFILKNETHHWLGPNEGHEMSKVIARNAAKSRDGSTRVLAISNAHAPGENSDAEHDFDAWTLLSQAGQAEDLLYDSVEADELASLDDDEAVLKAIRDAAGDSTWVDPVRLLAEIRDPRTPPAMARRFYLNQLAEGEDRPFDAARFAELRRPGYLPAPKSLIVLGFDGSLTRDHTALVGTEIETGHQWLAGYWEPQLQANGETAIPFGEVDQTVDYLFETFDVWRMYADPYKWGAYLAAWASRHGEKKVFSWPTTNYRKMASALAQYRVAIERRDLSNDGDPRFLASIANSHKHMQQFRDDDGELMWVIQKERPDSPLKIDAAVAATLSWQARLDALAGGASSSASVYESHGLRTI